MFVCLFVCLRVCVCSSACLFVCCLCVGSLACSFVSFFAVRLLGCLFVPSFVCLFAAADTSSTAFQRPHRTNVSRARLREMAVWHCWAEVGVASRAAWEGAMPSAFGVDWTLQLSSQMCIRQARHSRGFVSNAVCPRALKLASTWRHHKRLHEAFFA